MDRRGSPDEEMVEDRWADHSRGGVLVPVLAWEPAGCIQPQQGNHTINSQHNFLGIRLTGRL